MVRYFDCLQLHVAMRFFWKIEAFVPWSVKFDLLKKYQTPNLTQFYFERIIFSKM